MRKGMKIMGTVLEMDRKRKKYFDYSQKGVEDKITQYLNTIIKTEKDITILCIGTDRSTGDCLGPLVGLFLKNMEARCEVLGDLHNPIHAQNLDMINTKSNYVIVVDACLGTPENVGNIMVKPSGITPGSGVGKKITGEELGNTSILPIVNFGGCMDFFILQNTRLSMVYKQAQVVAKSLYQFIQKRKRNKELLGQQTLWELEGNYAGNILTKN